jgi:adenylosuccinate lyase
LIERYTLPEMGSLWSEEAKFQSWLEVEIAACEANAQLGRVPQEAMAAIRERARFEVPRILEIEAEVRHDVIAFLTHVEELAGPPARWLHRGMTSSDVLDTSLALLLVRSVDAILPRFDRLLEALARRVDEHRATPMIGRSHGIHAEPTTFGVALAGHLAELARARRRVAAARGEIAFGKIAGAVGTYAHLTPAIEADALGRLGLAPETVATQVVPRDRHAVLASALSLVAAAIERLATNIRHWQRTEVLEAEEPFTKGQKGSSAMPHKRNPILSENLCGLARIVRGGLVPTLENVALWHERDISHSSVERMMLPDCSCTLHFMLREMTAVVKGLGVYPENMSRNLNVYGGVVFSQRVLLALVESGLSREDAYRIVQRHAHDAWNREGGDFRANLASDPEVSALLSEAQMEACFSTDLHRAQLDVIWERLGI